MERLLAGGVDALCEVTIFPIKSNQLLPRADNLGRKVSPKVSPSQ